MSSDDIAQILAAVGSLRESVMSQQLAGQRAIEDLSNRIAVVERTVTEHVARDRARDEARDLEFAERCQTLIENAKRLIAAAENCAARMHCMVKNPTGEHPEVPEAGQ